MIHCTLWKIINYCTLLDYFIQISKLLTFFRMPKAIYNCNKIATPSIPLISDVAHLWSKTEHDTVKCLINADILKVPEVYKSCGAYDLYSFKSITTNQKLLRCNKRQCRNQISILNGTFFPHTKLLLRKVIHFLYLWLFRTNISIIQNMLSALC